MKWILAFAAVVLPFELLEIFEWFGPAQAQSAPCFPPGDIQKAITGPEYNEQLAFIGLSGKGQKVMLYSNATTATWTLVVDAGAMACIIAAGKAGTKVEPDKRIPGQGL